MNYETDLYILAYTEVNKEQISEITNLEKEIETLRNKSKLFHSGKLDDIPKDPILKKEMHDKIESDLESLIKQNNQIIESNKQNKRSVEDKYKEEINNFVTNNTNRIRAAWITVRKERDRLLSDSDFVQLSDSKLKTTLKQSWKDYRQSLRDIPQTNGDPFNILWPIKPEYEKE